MQYERSLVWLRRDLRLDDHAALYEAGRQSAAVVLAFVLDPALLRDGEIGAPQIQVFFSSLEALRTELQAAGSDLIICEGKFTSELVACARELKINAVFYNRDTDPRVAPRDQAVTDALEKIGITVHACNDLTYFQADDIRQDSGKLYTVFTPYKNRWLARRAAELRAPYASRKACEKKLMPAQALGKLRALPTLEEFGHKPSTHYPLGGAAHAQKYLKHFLSEPITAYKEARNFPAMPGSSRLSPQLRAGTIGIRHCVEAAAEARLQAKTAEKPHIDTWISELIWRDFYHQILVNNPTVVSEPYDKRARGIAWGNNPEYVKAWQKGVTGYPIVDAAMRQLHSIGWMHNRLRMIVASFLTKDLLVDYRIGEAHFMHWLADGDLAANNGGWQWAASTGTDAAPYFRVFNPVTQSKTYDPDGLFIRSLIPELAQLSNAFIHAPWMAPPLVLKAAGIELGSTYPLPIVDHAQARLAALDAFGAVFGKHASADAS